MLTTNTIVQIPVDNPVVFAFRIRGEVGRDDMKAMAATMNHAFDVHDAVSMLLIFEQFNGTDTGAGLDLETLKSQFRSFTNVEKYAVVGAPSAAETMINLMDKVIPIDAETFDVSDEAAAWRFVGANPITTDRR